ncbi:MAG: B12-binding domain-containing protein [Myxococcales bacterium]|nr:B12-binding domain-containing protein [Myxococcales bacterium]MCB9706467.1 B12-binding domain-containing protein [Myxococcales bacterium]
MTGVSAATLRAWERRYGIPSPSRTASAYRLYSDRDIALVRQVRELCEGGMAPSQAAQVVLTRDEAPPPPIERPATDADAHALAVQRILDAVDRFDADQLESAVKHALFLGPSVTVFEAILAPTLNAIGARWEEGSLSVGQEHLAAELIGNAVRYVLRLVQPEGANRVALLACFADEEHVTPLYGIALRFAEWGFKTVMLGGRTPTYALRHAVAEVNPDIVGLSLTITPPPYRARELIDGYAEACGQIPWIVGGKAAPELGEQVSERGGIIAPSDPRLLRELVERLLAARSAATRH